MTDSDERLEDWRPVAPMDGCTFSGYEASDKGRYRSIDRKSGNRSLKGKVLSTRLDDGGYVLVNIRCDSTDPDHNRVHTFLGHKVTLCTFAGPPKPGQEACHSPRGPAFNWWPEGVRWGTKPENHADQVAAGTATTPEPSFPCRNAPTCTNMVRGEGKRCRDCVVQLGVDAAALLNDGTPLTEVARHFRVSDEWVFRLAGEYGGYEGTREQARGEHRPCQCGHCQQATPQQVTFRQWLRSVMNRRG
jgi:NUMOD4 motif